jgi:hypothetical protein
MPTSQPADCNSLPLPRFFDSVPESIAGKASPVAVVRELDAGRPVGAKITWSSGLAHFVVLQDYRKTDRGLEYTVKDPLYGLLRISDWSLTHAYLCDGTWTHYYLAR